MKLNFEEVLDLLDKNQKLKHSSWPDCHIQRNGFQIEIVKSGNISGPSLMPLTIMAEIKDGNWQII